MKKMKGFLGEMPGKKATDTFVVKPNIDDVEDEIVNKVIEQFDFEKARSLMVLTARDIDRVPTIDELKKRAKHLLLWCMEHQDREFWWAGGMHHGGLCATYDDMWGLSLIYIGGVSRVRICGKLNTTTAMC